ncbi:zf-TFIIB domain-containing protein [Desmonostoc muscorum LEGE 12446]|uniref:TFIIB-type zinc ribbon-containing protein n=1 Tax=Desmonostoc muscorum TaxID=1179 RepID=UPI001F18D95D|nr:zf-TFIIB domain-containing protein [Desmonostoc muscorum LEGE 12446]
MSNRQGVEIDYCPQCRGIWLDRGELEKLIERSTEIPFEDERYTDKHQRKDEYREGSHGEGYRERKDEYREGSHGEGYRGEKRRKKSFLGELFDF